MGLPKSFLKLLSVDALLWPAGLDHDKWGNDVPFPPADIQCFIAETTSGYGTGIEGDLVTETPHDTTVVYTDWLGIKLSDRIEFPEAVGADVAFTGQTKRKVTNVVTYRDKAGAELFQQITVITD